MNTNKIIKINGMQSTRGISDHMKWLELIHGVVQILRNDDNDLPTLISFLSQCWNYPERTSVRIEFGGSKYFSSCFKNSPQALFASFDLENGERGIIEICEEAKIEWQFVFEEQEVLDSIAEMIGFAVDNRFALETLHNKLR